MALMLDIVKGALRLINELEAGGVPNAADAQDVLEVANGILAQLAAQNIYTGASDGTLQDMFPLEQKHELGFKAYLAKHIAPMFGGQLGAEVEAQALRGWQLIAADYFAPEPLRVDLALSRMPSQRFNSW
jgi:hypothetical protein